MAQSLRDEVYARLREPEQLIRWKRRVLRIRPGLLSLHLFDPRRINFAVTLLAEEADVEVPLGDLTMFVMQTV